MCGIIAPILFTSIVIALGLLRPGYSHISDAISRLGEVGAPNAVVQDINFIVTGILIILFGVGLHRGISEGRGSKVGPALVSVLGAVSFVGSGFFPLPGPLHAPIAISGFILFVIGILVITRRLKRDGEWMRVHSYSLATGVFMAVMLVVLFSTGQGVLMPWFGFLQRLFVAPMLLWIEVMAIRLLAVSNRPRS